MNYQGYRGGSGTELPMATPMPARTIICSSLDESPKDMMPSLSVPRYSASSSRASALETFSPPISMLFGVDIQLP